jgi:hypothetical protein
MMTTNNPNEHSFDQILVRALKQHSETVPGDFTTNVQSQIRKTQEQRILARVIWQERLTLVGSIALAGLAICVVVIFQGYLTETYRNFVDNLATDSQAAVGKMLQMADAFSVNWQQYAILAVISIFALYSLADFLIGHRIRVR